MPPIPLIRRPIFSTEVMAAMDPKLAAHYDLDPSPPPPTPAEIAASTAAKFERTVHEWRNIMLEYKAIQDQATGVRKRRKPCEHELLQLMETLDRTVHQVSPQQTLIVANTTKHQSISEKYLAEQLPKIVHDPELAKSIHQFLLSQRTTKAAKRLKVARRPPTAAAAAVTTSGDSTSTAVDNTRK